MERIDEIKQRLEGIEGRSYDLDNGGIFRKWMSGSVDTLLCYSRVPAPDMVAKFRSKSDAVFIAKAPEDVRWLLKRIGELEYTVETLRELRDEESRGR